MANQEFDLDAFIASVNQDKSQQKSDPHGKLNKLLMNTRDNQGTATIIPIMSRKTGQFYMKISRVYEFFAETSLLDAGEAWHKILPIDCYGELTDRQINLYNEVKGYIDTLDEEGDVDYDEFRVRNYVIFHGILDNLVPTNKEAKRNTDILGCPHILVYPSNSVIDAFLVAINNKMDAMKGSKAWIPYVLTPERSGRKGVMQISFNKSTGAGYDSSVSFEFNSELNTVIDPAYEISEDVIAMYDDILPTFLGWMYDRDAKSYFNTRAFEELRDQLKHRVQMLSVDVTETPKSEANFENKNDLNAPKASNEPPF